MLRLRGGGSFVTPSWGDSSAGDPAPTVPAAPLSGVTVIYSQPVRMTMGFGKDGKGAMIRENATVALSTLGAGTSILTGATAIEEDFRILRSEIMVLVANLTAGEGVGLLFGICNGELSATEVAEAIKAEGPRDRNDRLKVEQAERNVKVLSALDVHITDTQVLFKGENGGPIIVSKHRWTYSNPEGWDFFIHNPSSGPLTTGAVVDLQATHFGVWVT